MHKPPDIHARAIAYRLARYYAFKTGQRPQTRTRTLADGAQIAYAHALEELFEVLGIQTGVRSPMKWAIANIQDEDLLSLNEILVSAISGEPVASKERQDDQLSEMLKALHGR